MVHRSIYSTLLGVALTASLGAGEPDVKKAEQSVQERLRELGAAKASVTRPSDEAVARALPGQVLFAVRFPLYPVAQVPPEPLKPQNFFAVGPDGKPKLINDAKGLEEFFRVNAAAVKNEKAARDAAMAWLRLSEELAQDGYYKFSTVEEATKVTDEKGTRTVSARSVVMSGGNGEVAVTLSFDEAGKLAQANEAVRLKPGPRPRCHATQLLNPDPILRAIVEQDLLIMGRAAKAYLDEQRAQADPELQRAIDRMWQRIEAADR